MVIIFASALKERNKLSLKKNHKALKHAEKKGENIVPFIISEYFEILREVTNNTFPRQIGTCMKLGWVGIAQSV